MNEAVKFKLTLGNARQALPETQTQVRPGERLRAHQSIIKERTCVSVDMGYVYGATKDRRRKRTRARVCAEREGKKATPIQQGRERERERERSDCF